MQGTTTLEHRDRSILSFDLYELLQLLLLMAARFNKSYCNLLLKSVN